MLGRSSHKKHQKMNVLTKSISVLLALWWACIVVAKVIFHHDGKKNVTGSSMRQLGKSRERSRGHEFATNRSPNATRPCSPGHECLHNSTCVYEDTNGNPLCDCSTARSPVNSSGHALMAGKYCEYEATMTCQDAQFNTHFCVNGGVCDSTNLASGCVCPNGFGGKRCEYPDYNIPSVGLGNINNEEEENEGGEAFWNISGKNERPDNNNPFTIEDEESKNSDSYCGLSWVDASRNCRVPCPTGESAYCARILGDEKYSCQPKTGCAAKSEDEELDYLVEVYPPTPAPLYPPSPGPSMLLNTSPTEYRILENFYYMTNGNSWTRSDGWLLPNVDICKWHGIQCDKSLEYRTISINLTSNALRGSIDTILRLRNLTSLDLSNNELYGSVPGNFSTPSELRTISLANNYLRGHIPSSLSLLPMLEELDLRNNSLSSFDVASEGYPKLRLLHLDGNFLRGTLEPSMLSIQSLEELTLSRNRLEGYIIPEDFASLNNLIKLDLSFNSLEGIFPDLKGLSNLQQIEVVGNQLTAIHPDACKNGGWNDGNVELYGCDGIACPVSTAGKNGRQTSNTTGCEKCPSATYVGTVNCVTPAPSPLPVAIGGENGGNYCGTSWIYANSFCLRSCPTGANSECSDLGPGFRCFANTGCSLAEEVVPSPSPTAFYDKECTLQCLNGGVCAPGGFGGQREWCRCSPGWTGINCESRSPIFQPTPPPSMPLAFSLDIGPNSCQFYAVSNSGRLSSFESFCGGGAGYADLGTVIDITVLDPRNNLAFGLRENDLFQFDLETGDIVREKMLPYFPDQNVIAHFDAIEMANGKLYGVGWLDYGDNLSGSQDIILYEMDPETLEITRRVVVVDRVDKPIVGLAYDSTQGLMLAASSCDDNSNGYQIDLNSGEIQFLCGDMPACFESLAFLPDEGGGSGALFGGTRDGCIARSMMNIGRCDVLDCDTRFAWSSHFDSIAGLAVVCPTSTPSPSATVTPVNLGSVWETNTPSATVVSTSNDVKPVASGECPENHACQNGARCVPRPGSIAGLYICDCQSASNADSLEFYAGVLCEYKATAYCTTLANGSSASHDAEYSFCTNGGACVELGPGNAFRGCECPDGFRGKHCERPIVIADDILSRPESNATSQSLSPQPTSSLQPSSSSKQSSQPSSKPSSQPTFEPSPNPSVNPTILIDDLLFDNKSTRVAASHAFSCFVFGLLMVFTL